MRSASRKISKRTVLVAAASMGRVHAVQTMTDSGQFALISEWPVTRLQYSFASR